jgi:hypothetical protein
VRKQPNRLYTPLIQIAVDNFLNTRIPAPLKETEEGLELKKRFKERIPTAEFLRKALDRHEGYGNAQVW